MKTLLHEVGKGDDGGSPVVRGGDVSDEQGQTEKRSGDAGRRSTDLVATVKAVDSGVSLAWRWVSIVTTIVCAVFVAGITYAGFDAMKNELKEVRRDVSTLSEKYNASHEETALMKKDRESDRKDIDRIDKAQQDQAAQLRAIQEMRMAMVYSSANAVLRKQQSLPTPP